MPASAYLLWGERSAYSIVNVARSLLLTDCIISIISIKNLFSSNLKSGIKKLRQIIIENTFMESYHAC
jgi:hypothetical protein